MLGTGTIGGLVNLGGGQYAPIPGSDVSGGVSMGGLAPLLTQGYQAPGTVTAQGKIVGFDNATGQPMYDTRYTDPNVQTTQAAMPTAQDMLNEFEATSRGLIPSGDSGGAGYAVKTSDLAGLLAGNPGAPSAANGGGSAAPLPSNGSPAPVAGGSPTPPTGPANDVSHPSTPGFSGLLGAASGTSGNSTGTPVGVPSSGASPSGLVGSGVNLTPTTVDNALTNSTISPNNTVDRQKLAEDSLKSWATNVGDPQYEANLRDAQRHAFGAGRGVSGQLRTNLGNVESDYGRTKANMASTLMNAATNGSIEDLYRNIGIAQQQQGFQNTQQQQAFGNSLQQLLAGSSGDPSQLALALAQIYGGQAGQAGSSAANLLNQQGQSAQSSQIPQWLQDLVTSGSMNSILQQGVPGVQTTPGMGY